MCASFFGTGRPVVSTPDVPPGALFARVRESGAGFYLTHGWMDDRLAVNRALWDGSVRPPAGWRLLYRHDEDRPIRIRLYGIGRTAPAQALNRLREQMRTLQATGIRLG